MQAECSSPLVRDASILPKQKRPEPPPQLHLPFGLSFHDSFFTNDKYNLLNEASQTPLSDHESSESYERTVHVSDGTLRIPRKPVGMQPAQSPSLLYTPLTPTPRSATSQSNLLLSKTRSLTTAKIYWLIPGAATLFFVTGLTLAVGHYTYLRSLHEKKVENQVWVGRYSLTMAFLVKAFLSTAISIAFAQRVWHTLQRTRKGMSMLGIDALFSADQSPLAFVSWEVWRHASVSALLAVSVWLMPLIQIVAPTALTIGASQNALEDPHCSVPLLNNIMNLPVTSPNSLSLFDVDYEGILFNPSTTARYLVDLTAQGGLQLGWDSPCGSNCTYDIRFVAPAWKCDRTNRYDRSDGYWPYPWFSGYGDGSNYSTHDSEPYLEWSPIYQASYNSETGLFWVGATDSVDFKNIPAGMNVKDFLDLHLYICSIVSTVYRLRVTYVNHRQINDIVELSYKDIIKIPQNVWQGNLNQNMANAAFLGVVSLYSPLIDLLAGNIVRSPQEGIVSNTSIGSLPSLVHIYNGSMEAGQEDPYIPVLAIGPQLEKLSQNITISLLSQAKLDTTTTTETTCSMYETTTVWKFKPAPLITAYLCSVGAAAISLILGGHALLAAGVARDRSFSSIVRSTRHRDLDALCADDQGNAALPLGLNLRKRRFKFSTDGYSHATNDTSEKRMSFRPVQEFGDDISEKVVGREVGSSSEHSPNVGAST